MGDEPDREDLTAEDLAGQAEDEAPDPPFFGAAWR